MALKEAFPDLYGIACAKDASVAAHLEILGGSNQWNVSFARAAHDWEVDVFASFFRVLYSVRVRREGEDKLWWVPSKRGLFVVRSFYSVLVCNDGFHFPWKSVWRTKVPLRVAFFAWSAALGKILTMDNLRKRHVIVVDRCCMCKRNGESVDHLLLHCEVAGALWDVFFSRFGLSWVMPRRVVDLYACWWTAGSAQSAAVWKMVPLCLLWCLWREMNDRSFEDRERTLEEIKSLFFYTLYLWTAAFVSPLVISYHDFLVLFFLLLVRCFLMYTSCVLGAPYAFNDISITYKPMFQLCSKLTHAKVKKKQNGNRGFFFFFFFFVQSWTRFVDVTCTRNMSSLFLGI
jgi:hypothetical protein